MKKINIFAALALSAISMLSFLACTDEEDVEPEQKQESGVVTSFDQVEYFQNSIVAIDSAGNITQRYYGKMLNKADSTELYVAVDSLGEAKSLFEEWLSPDTKLEVAAPSVVNLKATLCNAAGVEKETVYFNVVTEKGKVAEVTFKSGDAIKHITKIVFMKMNDWPANAQVSEFSVGDTTYTPTIMMRSSVWSDHREPMKNPWVCIREAKPGQAGWLMLVHNEAYGYSLIREFLDIHHIPKVPTAVSVSKLLRTDWDTYVALFADAGSTLRANEFYITSDTKLFGFYNFVNLKSSEVDWKFTTSSYFFFLRTFGLVEE